MPVGNEGTSGVDTSGSGSATTLDDFINDAFTGRGEDDFGFGSAPQSEPGSDAVGDSPTEPAAQNASENQSTETDGPEGDAKDGATKDAAAKGAPDKDGQEATAHETAQPDPLATATAVNYVVNGQTRQYDALRHIPGMGAVIKEADLPQLQQRLSERDHLFETSREQYKALTDLEQRSAWKVRQPDGTEKTLTGAAGLEESRVVMGRSLAALEVLSGVLRDPRQFMKLIGVDAQGNIVPDQEQLEYLLTRSQLREQQVEQQIRSQFQSQGTIQRTSAQDAQAPSGQINVPDTFVDQYAAQLGVTGLAPEDKAILQAIAPRFIRLATSEDVMQNPTLKVGTPVIENAFADQVKHYAGLRATAAKTVQTGAAATQAALQAQKENSARLAAAKTTPKPSAKPGKAPDRPRNDDGTFAKSNAAWDFLNG